MNGAQSLLQTLVNGGVEVCFTNPGTTEIPFVAALEEIRHLRPVLGLFEGVCTGAADGYARMAGKPAMTLLHLGPGLANGLANLHNARRANSPVINIIGDHATYHRPHDPRLASDIRSLASPVSGWVGEAKKPEEFPELAATALNAAVSPPGQVATLIVPANCARGESGRPAPVQSAPKPSVINDATVEQIANVLRKGEPTVMLVTGPALLRRGLELAGRISAVAGARLMANRVNARIQRGAGRVMIERLPYFPEHVMEKLAGTAHLILVGARPPISLFAYPGLPNWLTPEGCQLHTLAREGEDSLGALSSLADMLDAVRAQPSVYALNRPPLPTGEINPDKVWQSLAAHMPEESVICDESNTSGQGSDQWTAGAPPHDWLALTGASIGIGLPLATGAAVACPDKKVFCMQADGSAMYTFQALWTQAREKLDVVTILFSNRAYRILKIELARAGVEQPGAGAESLMDLTNPDIDWVSLAEGMGVRAGRADTAEEFNALLQDAVHKPGPCLIEVTI
jgi:acetolactate synthase-1/2/3 large subunit